MKSTLLCTALTSSLLSFNSFAEEPAQVDDSWKIAAELGLLVTTGNTESSSLFTKISAAHQKDSWKQKYTFNTLVKEDQLTDDDGSTYTEETANQYALTGQGDYIIGEFSAAFIFGSYTNTEFSSYKQYTTVAAGYSFRAINEDNLSLDLNFGPGFTETETQDGVTENGAIARASLGLVWDISKNARFEQNVSVESGEANTRTIAESALVSSLNETFKMKFGFALTNDTDVPDGLEKTDTETSATIIVSF